MCVKQVYYSSQIQIHKYINIIHYIFNIIHKILICSVECISFMSNHLTAKSDEALAQITYCR